MNVSVVLCTYASEMYDEFTEAAESVLGQTYDPVELVVVVDGNEEIEGRVTTDFGDAANVLVVSNRRNVGLLESRNRGTERATGDVVAFIDDDAVADDRWIEALVETYDRHDAVAVGGRMVPDWVAGKPPYLPAEFYWLVGVTHRGFAEEEGEVRNTFGSNLSFRRDVFLELGGFDTDIGGRKGDTNLQGGETELCARMRREFGRGVVYNPDAVVAHKVYEYRTRTRWLLDRAFWQGYSKRAMERMVAGSGATESAYLRKLLFDFVPRRFTDLLKRPSVARAGQLLMLLSLTTAVGVGYLYGAVRW